MNIVTGSALREALEGLDWRELDALAEVSEAKRDFATLNAVAVELHDRSGHRQPDPIGFALSMRKVDQALRRRGFTTPE